MRCSRRVRWWMGALGVLLVGGIWLGGCGAPARTGGAAAPATAPPAARAPAESAPAAASAPTSAPAAAPSAGGEREQAAPAAFDERAVADFYRGKTIRIITGSAPGGTYDTYSRMLARHMPRYLPGSPTMVVEARPGAGGVLAANTVYSTEPKDGTVIGTFGETLVLQQALGATGVQYDAAKFQWIGSAVNTAMACAARTDSGITSMRDVLDGKPFVIGTMAPGSATYDVPAVINAALGLNMKLVTGYDGVSRLILATESKEVDGYCASFISMTTTAPQPFQGDPPMARIVVIMGDKTSDHPWLAGVPAAETLATTDEARQLLRAAQASAQITNPYTVAPEVPRDRVEALRKAFWETFNDPQFLAEAQQVGMTFSPSNGEQVTRVVESLLATPPATLARLKEIIVK